MTDSTGIKFLGDGALSWFASKPLPGNKWQARKHGVQSRRQWRKVHLSMDTATSDIRAVEFTPSREGDSPVVPDLLDQIPEGEDIGTVTADGAYDPGLRPFRAELIHWINSGTPFTPPLPRRRHRTRRHGNHTDPKERSGLERGLPGRQRPQRNPARHASLRPGILEAVDRIPRPQPRGGQDAMPEGLR